MLALFATIVMVTAVSTSFLADDGDANGDSSFEAFSDVAQKIIEGKATPKSGINFTVNPDWNGVDPYRFTFSDAPHSNLTALSSCTSKILKLTVGSASATSDITVSNDGTITSSINLVVDNGSSDQGTLSIAGTFNDVIKNPKLPMMGYLLSGSFFLTYDGLQPFTDDIKLEVILKGINNSTKKEVTVTITFTLKVTPGTHYFNLTNNMGLSPNSTGIFIYTEDSNNHWSVTNGKISNFESTSSLNATTGQNVLIALYPSDGDKVRSISVTDGSGGVLNCTQYSNGMTGKDTQKVWMFTMPDSDVNVDVEFNHHTISIIADNGKVSTALNNGPNNVTKDGYYRNHGKGYYFLDDVVKLTPSPVKGYEFVSWECDGLIIDDNKFTMPDRDVTIKAVFEPISYVISLENGSGGTLVCDVEEAIAGREVTVTATPSHGFVLDSLTMDGTTVSVDSDGRYTFTMPSKAVKFVATFKNDGKASSLSCESAILSNGLTRLDVQIDCRSDALNAKDLRILVVAKYGSNVINVYSKPVIGNGTGTDAVFVSTSGLTEVVLQLVDGIQPGDDGSVQYFAYTYYVPDQDSTKGS